MKLHEVLANAGNKEIEGFVYSFKKILKKVIIM